MFPVNSIYGQDLLLALHCGLDSAPPIWGLMQHAWMPDLPVWEGESWRSWWPLFVYSERNRRLAEDFLGPHGPRVIAIGSPFLYLERLLRSEGDLDDSAASPSTIFYPYHYFGDEETEPWHVRLAAHVRERYGEGTTLCLHGHDHQNPRIRAAHRDAGLRVITHGDSASPAFLLRQHAELLRHGRVVANRVSTPLWHAAALGRDVSVEGPIFGVIGQLMAVETPEEIEQGERERWPELFAGVHGADARQLADRELGAEHLRTPNELRDILGWSSLGRVRSAAVNPALKAIRYARARRTRSTSSDSS